MPVLNPSASRNSIIRSVGMLPTSLSCAIGQPPMPLIAPSNRRQPASTRLSGYYSNSVLSCVNVPRKYVGYAGITVENAACICAGWLCQPYLTMIIYVTLFVLPLCCDNLTVLLHCTHRHMDCQNPCSNKSPVFVVLYAQLLQFD